jgi:hypothetical protein
MHRILSFFLSVTLLFVVAASAYHNHDDANHGDRHACQLCLFANASMNVPHAHHAPVVYAPVTSIDFRPVAVTLRGAFVPVPDSRGPPQI